MFSFTAKVQLQQTIDPVNALMIPPVVLSVQDLKQLFKPVTYAFKVKFMPGYSKYQRPYVMCTSCNNANGISLAPFYNNSSAESGEVYFNLIDTGGNKVKPNELISGMMFFIEIVCL